MKPGKPHIYMRSGRWLYLTGTTRNFSLVNDAAMWCFNRNMSIIRNKRDLTN